MEKVYEIYIKATPERVWEAITDPEIRAKYHFGAAVESDWTEGLVLPARHLAAERPLIEGENLIVERPNRLVQTMRALGSRRRAGRHVPGDVGDRAGRRLVPPDGGPRSTAI